MSWVLNKNIFCASNPAKMADALWEVLKNSDADLSDMLIFLPSRRALRSVEKMLVEKSGGALILPCLVALGEGADSADDVFDDDDFTTDFSAQNVISNTLREMVLTRLLSADSHIDNICAALPVAQDLVRMVDYLENEGINAADICWTDLIDEKYADHWTHKASLLNILSKVLPEFYNGRITEVQKRNYDIRAWIPLLHKYKLVVVCCSTGSVPATADLMYAVAKLPQGRILLSGKISGNISDFELNTNPYNSEYNFLNRVGITYQDVIEIDVGKSAIDCMNNAFSNTPVRDFQSHGLGHCHLIECNRESEEANVAAEIAARAVEQNKSVLIITPDAAGNQRIATAMNARGIIADFSGGQSGAMTCAGRAILNLFDDWLENKNSAIFDKLYSKSGYDLFKTIVDFVAQSNYEYLPDFEIDDAASVQIWDAISKMSDCLNQAEIKLELSDVPAFLRAAVSTVSVRNIAPQNPSVIVLGTIESRMQTADVVILTGLNEGMFPAQGYENSWLPRSMCDKIGLPSSDRKVSLMALDFMNLSCGDEVYWLRSKTAGGVQTTESRFLSRVCVSQAAFDTACAADILSAVRCRDLVPARALDYSLAQVPADWSDVYVTELDLLIHNPYAFYCRHILKLRPIDDFWAPIDARAFGNLVHNVIETSVDFSPDALVLKMDAEARKLLGNNSVLFYFWHKNFLEMAPVISKEFSDDTKWEIETGGMVKIAGRNVRARADRIWNAGVLDIKTGVAPAKSKLLEGTAPQLPLEAYIMQKGGFLFNCKNPVMKFLQLKSGKVMPIEYDVETTQSMMDAAVLKTTELFNMYSAGAAQYEHRLTSDKKYQAYDGLARIKD